MRTMKRISFYLGHFWLAVDPSTCLFNHGQLSNLQRLALGLYLGGNFYGKWNGDNEYFDLVCSCNSLLFDKITETFVCSWFFEGCFSVSVITALYSSRVFFFFRNVVKKPKFSLRMKSPEYVLLYTDELKASRLGKTFLMNPSFDFWICYILGYSKNVDSLNFKEI